ncbi:hypothetical protein QE152_g8589 [Popillia japonica]|uniref:Uncharacterized protein n=1 Tax=Popillia japonica TaxID=7064 RepID=A0AAW1M405_POPJA
MESADGTPSTRRYARGRDSPSTTSEREMIVNLPTNEDLVQETDENVVCMAIHKLKNRKPPGPDNIQRKPPGPDNIQSEVLKETVHEITPSLVVLFNSCLQQGRFLTI